MHRESFFRKALSRLHLSLGHQHLSSSFSAERRSLLALSRERLDTSDKLHAKGLHVLYECCVQQPCPARFGAHWEVLGFQGKDPGTDFRGAGMLALMHLLHFFSYNRDNAERVWHLSTSESRVCYNSFAECQNITSDQYVCACAVLTLFLCLQQCLLR
jgi:hypothetical protein